MTNSRTATSEELKAILTEHKKWITTKGQEGKRADFRNFQMSDADLVGAYLPKARFTHADLRGADLSEAHLDEADFRNANLRSATLSDARLTRAILSQADLSEGTLHNAHMGGAKLTQATLNDTDLSEAYLGPAGKGEPGANLDQATLIGANFWKANLQDAILTNTDLSHAGFEGADLTGARLINACLHGAILHFAQLGDALLDGAQLQEAQLCNANLSGAQFHSADLSDANLEGAILVQTVLIDANLTGARVYGISAWDVQASGSRQNNLIITTADTPTLTVNDLEVAQFIYFLLNNRKIRHILEAATSKVVLILGSFRPERKIVLDAVAELLRKYDLAPVIFDFERARSQDLTETIQTLAGLSFFVIADITQPRSVSSELRGTVPNYKIPFVPIIQKGEEAFAMFRDLAQYPWMIELLEYSSIEELQQAFYGAILEPAFEKHKEMRLLKANQLQTRKAKDYLPSPSA